MIKSLVCPIPEAEGEVTDDLIARCRYDAELAAKRAGGVLTDASPRVAYATFPPTVTTPMRCLAFEMTVPDEEPV